MASKKQMQWTQTILQIVFQELGVIYLNKDFFYWQ